MGEVKNSGSIADVPVSAFAAVMGIAGLGTAWRRAGLAFGVAPWIGEVLIFTGVLVFAWIATAYGRKIMHSPQSLHAEFDDMTRVSFFACVPLSLQLFATGAMPLDRATGALMWGAGTLLQLILMLIIVRRWMSGGHFRRYFQPSLFLPSAGLLLGPAAAFHLGFSEAGWMMFSFGLLLWMIFLVLLFNRFIFDMPMADAELPLLAITVTPPALAFVSYTALNGQTLDAFARFLFYAMLFFVILILSHFENIVRSGFSFSWWAFTFPAAAAASAALEYRMAAGPDFPAGLCIALLGLATLLVIYCAVRSLMGLHSGGLFPEIK